MLGTAPAHWCRAEPAGMVTRLGVNAVKSLSNGETGVLVGYQKNEVTRTPLADIVGRTKPVDTELVELARILAK
jgi:6-phosphofructokinase 1